MEIAGFEKLSFIDYPGKACSIVFTPRCNFRCPYCHNFEIINGSQHLIPEKEVFSFLEKRKGVIDAVEITGGEPTLQFDLIEFIEKVRELGFLIKLDTNGSNPKMLKQILDLGIVNYVAMDVKAPLKKYELIAGVKVDEKAIASSIGLIMKKAPEYEFRTTVFPALKEQDFHEIGELIKGAEKYYLQQFRNKHTLAANHVVPYPPKKLKEFAEIMKAYVKKVEIRGI